MNPPSWLDRAEYPFASRYLKLPAGRIHYVDEGSGAPIVMVHGNPTWSFLYRHLIKQLRGEYRCVAPDHLGFGLSDKPRAWSYLPHEHAANLAALVDDLGLEKITLFVQDWGGPIGLSYAVEHPEKIAAIVIMNTWAWPVNRDPYYIAFSGFVGGPIGRMLIKRQNFFVNSIMRKAFGDKTKLTPAAHAQYQHPLDNPEDRKGCWVFPKQIIGSSHWLGQIWSRIDVLKEKPVLIAWGMKDIAFREKELKQWEQAFPAAQTVRLAMVGHFVQEEAPDELAAAVVPFLKTV